nr:PREDICTED: acidic repeat-containing protein-like isoform X2 [Bemisia tabaci]
MAFSMNIPSDEKVEKKKFPPSAPIHAPPPEPEIDSKYTNGCAMKMTRWLLLICASCLVLSALASPVLQGGGDVDVAKGRQADAAAAVVDNSVAAAASPAAAAPVAAAPAPAVTPEPEDDEDDEDDDDDDVDLDITDDDDDDDDEEENETAADDDDEDDDDDYDFERFFDDLLGDDDDDDEEEEESAPSAAPLSATPAPAATQAALTGLAASNVDYNSADYNAAPGEAPLSNDANDVYDEEDQETAPNTVTLVSAANEDAPQENAVSPSPSSTGDDDDEDDDDIDLSDDDDEEEDDDEGDEDDDDDDDEDESGAQSGRAHRARALSPGGETVAPAYIAKYNRFIDTILMRVNKILKKSYDPVNVRLQSPVDTKKKGPKPAATKKNKPKTKLKTKRRPVNKETRTDEQQLNRTSQQSQTSNAVSDSASLKVEPKNDQGSSLPTDGTTSPQQNVAASNRRQQRKRKVVKTKTKVQIARNNPRAKATLYGLSSMRRDGDVTANVMRSHTTVRAKFLVGPLTLKVEKEFGRGVKKELRSATATTAELVGKLNLRVVQGGAATLHSIRVLQPKQVRIDTGAPEDNDQDQTREFMWKRSSNIAHLVAEKLTAVTRSMLQPPPQQIPAEPTPIPFAKAA